MALCSVSMFLAIAASSADCASAEPASVASRAENAMASAFMGSPCRLDLLAPDHAAVDRVELAILSPALLAAEHAAFRGVARLALHVGSPGRVPDAALGDDKSARIFFREPV